MPVIVAMNDRFIAVRVRPGQVAGVSLEEEGPFLDIKMPEVLSENDTEYDTSGRFTIQALLGGWKNVDKPGYYVEIKPKLRKGEVVEVSFDGGQTWEDLPSSVGFNQAKTLVSYGHGKHFHVYPPVPSLLSVRVRTTKKEGFFRLIGRGREVVTRNKPTSPFEVPMPSPVLESTAYDGERSQYIFTAPPSAIFSMASISGGNVYTMARSLRDDKDVSLSTEAIRNVRVAVFARVGRDIVMSESMP